MSAKFPTYLLHTTTTKTIKQNDIQEAGFLRANISFYVWYVNLFETFPFQCIKPLTIHAFFMKYLFFIHVYTSQGMFMSMKLKLDCEKETKSNYLSI